MVENGSELRQIAWSQAFPFVRLFRTLRLSLNGGRLILSLAFIIISFLVGSLLDQIWSDKGAVTTLPSRPAMSANMANPASVMGERPPWAMWAGPVESVQTEIDAYAILDQDRFESWLGEAEKARERIAQPENVEVPPEHGPYIGLLEYESKCFTAAIQGACAGHWGFASSAHSPQPSMAGSLVSGGRGVCWLVTRRPWYALIGGLIHLFVLAILGGAICRSAAVQSARDESISIRESLRFACGRLGGFLLAPLLPVAIFVGIAVLMFVGGLIGAIPFLGELFTGVFYFLALLGGFALAVILLATVLGFNLMWPTISAEGSDGFDALSRACSYVGSRIWHVGFYWFVLLLYGAASFVLVRVLAMFVLKLSHKFTGLGMNLVDSAKEEGVGKLEALWAMPAWADMSLLPGVADKPFWGTFGHVPLDGAEAFGAWILMVWVFLFVGLVAAFLVSFFFCGSTQMYFLLRRNVDATDYEEVYYEEPEEEFPTPEPAPEPVPAAPESPSPEAPKADQPEEGDSNA